MLKAAEKDDSLYACAAADYLSWERQVQLLLGDSGDDELYETIGELRQSLSRGAVNAFTQSQARCQRRESTLYQIGRMIGMARILEFNGQGDLLPPGAAEAIDRCANSFDYRVDVEIEVLNEYNEQGRGGDIASSRTEVDAQGLIAKYDRSRSRGETLVFTSQQAEAKASTSIVSRNGCPDQARVQPGAAVSVTVEPIVNSRVGRLRCERGRVECDRADTNPGVLLTIAPHVVENTFVHTKSADRCVAPSDWNEFMMFFEGHTSVDGGQPFQVRGVQDSVTVVRYGGSVRQQPIDIDPRILQMSPGMKDYVEIRTPAIRSATERIRVTIREQSR
jgi:hypothetical protein